MFTKAIKQNAACICLFLAVSVALVSCDQQTERRIAPGPENENMLRFDVAAPLGALNPAPIKQSGTNNIFPLLYSFLCVLDNNGAVQPDLAEFWEYDPQSFIWTIRLRKNVRFHDGRSVTSTDVKYTFETVLNEWEPTLWTSINEISILSELVFNLRLNKDDPDFIHKISDIEIIPGPDHGIIDYYQRPIGSGPFQFKKRNGEKEIFLSAYPDYYNGRPKMDGIVFTYEPDKEKTWARLLAGETDAAQEITPKNYEIMKQYEDRFYFNHYTLWYYTILLYNTHDPLFADTNVRRALTMAIDRQYIVDTMLNGYAKVATGPMGVDSPYHNPDLKPLPYNPNKALELLYQAGWSEDSDHRYLSKNGLPFEFTLFILKEFHIEKKITQYIQLCLNDIGIKMNVISLPYEEFVEQFLTHKDFQAILTEFPGAFRRPENIQDLWGASENPEEIGFIDPEVVNLLNQVLKERDPAAIKKYMYQIDTLIAALQPGTFLFQKTAIDVMSKRFMLDSPLSLSLNGIYHLKDARLSHK